MSTKPENTDRPHRFRRKALIHPKFQLTIIGYNLVLALIAVVVFYLENMYLFAKFTDPSILPSDPVITEFLDEEKRSMTIVFLTTSGFVFLAMIIGGLILSNRVAGPVYRIQQYLQSFLSGSTKGNLKFRKGDFFPELADSVNQFIERFRENEKK